MRKYFMATMLIAMILVTACNGDRSINIKESNAGSVILLRAFPNPFLGHLNIYFQLFEKMKVTIIIQGPSGERIKTLCSRIFEVGHYSISWDGKNEDNEIVNDGFYFVSAKTKYGVISRCVEKFNNQHP